MGRGGPVSTALAAYRFRRQCERWADAGDVERENAEFDRLPAEVQDILTDPDYRAPVGRPPRYDEVFCLGTAWLDSL